MADYKRLAKAVHKILTPGDELPGSLGYTVNGSFRVVDVDDPKKYYVRFAEGTFVSAYHNNQVVQIPNLPVLVGVDDLKRPVIRGQDPKRINEFNTTGGGSNVGPHDHVRNSALAYITDTWLLKQLRMEVVSGYTVRVRPGPYKFHGTLYWWTQATLDLTAYVPSGLGYSSWVIVGIDPLHAALVAYASDPVFDSNTGDPADIPLSQFIRKGLIPIAAIFALGGDSTLFDYNIEDLRFAAGEMTTYLEDLYNVSSYSNYSGYVLGYQMDGNWVGVPQTGGTGGGTGGGGGGENGTSPVLLLDYVETTDAFSARAVGSSWTDVLASTNFTVTDPTALLQISVEGMVLLGFANDTDFGARVLIDGTTAYRMGGGRIPNGQYTNLLQGSSPVTIPPLSAGVHTIQVQAWFGSSGNMYLQASTAPNTYALRVQVLQLGAGSSGTPPPLLLDYLEASDLYSASSFPATTWTIIGSSHNFTVSDAAALIEIVTLLTVALSNTGGASAGIGARLVIDAGGTPIVRMIHGDRSAAGQFSSPGSGAIFLSGLAAGVHTVQVELYAEQSGLLYLRPSSVPNQENFSIQITQFSGGGGAALAPKRSSINTDKTTASTTPVPIDSTNMGFTQHGGYTLAIGDMVECILTGEFYADSGSIHILGDVEVDQPVSANVYVGVVGGASVSWRDYLDGQRHGRTWIVTFVATEAGVHAFRPVWYVGSGTGHFDGSDTLSVFTTKKLGV